MTVMDDQKPKQIADGPAPRPAPELETPSATAQKPVSSSQASPEVQSSAQPTQQVVTTKPADKRSGGPAMTIIVAMVVVIALAAFAYYAYTKSK
jgi:hypothetical protein